MSPTDTGVLEHPQLTLNELFVELTRRDCEGAVERLGAMPTDVMFNESVGALVDAAAYLRFVARQHARPGGPAGRRMLELAEELTLQAAEFQHAGDSAAIAIRDTADRRRSGA